MRFEQEFESTLQTCFNPEAIKKLTNGERAIMYHIWLEEELKKFQDNKKVLTRKFNFTLCNEKVH